MTKDYDAQYMEMYAKAVAERKAGGGRKRWQKYPWKSGRNTGRLYAFTHKVTEVSRKYLVLREQLGPPLSMFGGPEKVPAVGETIQKVGVPVMRAYRGKTDGRAVFSNGLGYKRECYLRKANVKTSLVMLVNMVPTGPESIDLGMIQVPVRTEWFGRKLKGSGDLGCYGMSHYLYGHKPAVVEAGEGGQDATHPDDETGTATVQSAVLGPLEGWGNRIIQVFGGDKAQDIRIIKHPEIFFQKDTPDLALDLTVPNGPVGVVSMDGSPDLPANDQFCPTDLISDPRWFPGFSTDGNHGWAEAMEFATLFGGSGASEIASNAGPKTEGGDETGSPPAETAPVASGDATGGPPGSTTLAQQAAPAAAQGLSEGVDVGFSEGDVVYRGKFVETLPDGKVRIRANPADQPSPAAAKTINGLKLGGHQDPKNPDYALAIVDAAQLKVL